MHKNLKYQILVILILLVGAIISQHLITSYQTLESQEIESKLKEVHSDAMLRAEAGIDVYRTIVSSFKSYTKNTTTFPTEKALQNYLNDLISNIKFKDSIILNYIDTSHVFKYVISPNKIDAPGLKGVSVKDFRGQSRIEELNKMMNQEDIVLFSPINLREGWAGFPFNFSARNNKDEILGYITPIINVKYLLNYFYSTEYDSQYVHKFVVNDSIDLTREVFYNGSEIFNTQRDPEYYKNFNVSNENFIYSNIDLFGWQLTIGSAYKNQPEVDNTVPFVSYVWYGLITILTMIVFNQFLKNRRLNTELVTANTELESNLHKIQTLIKEIHHRVKNNMHMIGGILTLQEEEHDDEKVIAALRQSKYRIQTMSLVHEKLYGSSTLKDIKIKDYIEELIDYVEQTVRSKKMLLDKTISIDTNFTFDGDTTSNLGLIVNELITNSFKYAFSIDKPNKLAISITKEKEMYKLKYSDSGHGLPKDFNFKETKSLGMQLIFILAEQLKGYMEYNNDDLSTFTIYFKPIENVFEAEV